MMYGGSIGKTPPTSPNALVFLCPGAEASDAVLVDLEPVRKASIPRSEAIAALGPTPTRLGRALDDLGEGILVVVDVLESAALKDENESESLECAIP